MPSNPQAKIIRGDRLTEAQRRQVLAAYIYRLTYENQREHPQAVKQAGGKVQMSDDQWIQEHAFRFTKSGRLSGRYAEPVYMAENPGIRAQVRRLPTGQIQIKIPLKLGRHSNPVRIESPDGNRLTRGIRIVERYGDQLLKRGNDPKFVAKVAREALGNWVQQATVIVDDGKGGRAYNPQGGPGQYGYIVFYQGKRAEIWTDKGAYAAQKEAAKLFKVPPKKEYLISVNLAERPDGSEVIHTAVNSRKGDRAYNPRTCNPSNTINRGWLKKRVAAGLMEAKLDYSIEHDGSGSNDTFGGKWMPARLSSGYGDFIEGQANFRSHDFTSKSGHAYRGPDGTINLIVHSNLAWTLRPIGTRTNPVGRFQVEVNSGGRGNSLVPSSSFGTLAKAKKYVSQLRSRGLLYGRIVSIHDTTKGLVVFEKAYV